MEQFRNRYLLNREDYGLLYSYIIDENVTDINWNGSQLWIDDLTKGRFVASETLSEDFVNRFTSLLASVVSVPFNKMSPVLEAETEELRLSIVHPSVAHSGSTISLRKIPAVRRLTQKDMIDSGYCSEKIGNFLKNCVKAHCNAAICGMPGAGKTELLKYMTKFIPSSERVITIEDTLEIHYQKINPGKDCVEMKVAERFTYTDAIKACLRQLPKWIILSEARSTEVRYLLESLSTGTYGMTTLHTDDVRNIPDRIKNMAEGYLDADRIVNDTYRFINVGVLVKSKIKKDGKIVRKIDQIGIFDRFGTDSRNVRNKTEMIVLNGNVVKFTLPINMKRRFEEVGIKDVFIS
ncbi:MAG: CpaF/VirB11 family protein [Lachnoclostridium sp.]|nr:CpaF/VirB11 family protein [Lachnoclostridium sp.]